MAEERAAWCLSTNQSVETYMSLSRVDREAFYTVIERSNRKR
jgi:hypothetical protein